MMPRLLVRAAAFTGLWWIMAGGAAGSWVLGVPAVAAATWASWRLRGAGPASLSPLHAARFLGFFLAESVKGGLDVARRTLLPRLGVAPCFFAYRTCLPGGLPRVLLASTVSLLPGTLTVDMSGDELLVHSLAPSADTVAGVALCEQRIVALFGLAASAGEEVARRA